MFWAGGAAVLSVFFLVLGARSRKRGALDRLRALDGETDRTADLLPAGRNAPRLFATIIELPYRMTPARLRRPLYGRLDSLSEPAGLTVPRLAGTCVWLTVGGPCFLILLTRFSTAGLVLAPVCGGLGLLSPWLIASRKQARLVEAVKRALPDTADMLYAFVLGGKNLDQAFRGAASLAPEPLGPFLQHAVRKMELGVTRREAFEELAALCPVRELASLLHALLEAERRGHSMAASLSVFSREIRLRRRDALRRAVAKAPLKMLAPLVFLILPASVLLTVGPTFLATLQRVF